MMSASEQHVYPPAIDVQDLVKVYPGGTRALDGISFSVAAGEVFGFLGPNGSGKTTAVRVLVTLLQKTSGVARICGFDTNRGAGQVRKVIGWAGQSVGVDDDFSVYENIGRPALLHGVPHEEMAKRVTDLMDAFSLTEVADQRARQLSGGMRRRLDLAQALVHKPKVLFLDEPTSGLDPQSRNALWEYLDRIRGEGVTIFLTTQQLVEADRACDRVAIIDRGRLLTVGTPSDLKTEVGEGRIEVTLRNRNDVPLAAAAMADLPGVARVQPGQPLVIYVRDVGANVAPVVRCLDEKGIRIASVEVARASLDDVFLRYTGERPRIDARVERAPSSLFATAHGRPRRS
jgi:ABC-type multidrug transport system ATPase subunit